MTALLVATLCAAAFVAWLLLTPRLRRRRRARLAGAPLTARQRRVLERWPLYRRLPRELRPRLEALVQVFLAEKEFVGCGGLTVTEPMRLAVALHACLLVLARDMHVYDELRAILLYPDEFVVQERWDEDGIVTEEERVLSGQAWDTSRIILSWRDVRESGEGYNVVLHEFAHYLDEEAGAANGMPLLADRRDRERWAAVMQRAWEQLRERTDAGHETLLDPYATEDEAEFFAVATETFFELPVELRADDPDLYAALARFYELDPASWARR